MKLFPPNAKCLLPSASLLAVLCLLSAVLCQPSRAAGSWLVDGQAVQAPAADPNALYTDGSRKMTAPLNFDASASVANTGILNAYIPWSGGYSDIFVMDEDNEVMWLASDQNVAFGVGSLFISSGRLTSFEYGSSINLEQHSLDGGWWVSSVLDDPSAIMSRSYADNRYILKSTGITITHTIQAGDVLQIQNGIITAINP